LGTTLWTEPNTLMMETPLEQLTWLFSFPHIVQQWL
jgi:hypothetical protein